MGRDALLHVGRPVLSCLHWLYGVARDADDCHHERRWEVSRSFALFSPPETVTDWTLRLCRYEFATLGMIWIYAFVSLVCLSALTIKTLLSLRLSARRRLEPVPPSVESQSTRRYRPTEQVRPRDWAEEQEEYGVGSQQEEWRRGDYSWDEKRGGERPPNE